MKFSRQLLAGCLTVSLTLSVSVVCAHTPPVLAQSLLGPTVVGQATATEAERRRESDDLLKNARKAFKAGDLDQAESYLARAEKLNATYDSLFSRFQETPQKMRKELDAAKAKAPKSSKPSDRFAPSLLNETNANAKPTMGNNGPPTLPANRRDATELLTQDAGTNATNALNSGTRSSFLLTPDEASKLPDRMPKFGAAREAMYQAIDRGENAVANAVQDAKGESDRLLLEARRAVAQGNARQASELLAMARALNITYPFNADSPDRVEALLRKSAEFATKPNGDTPEQSRQRAQMLLEQAEGLMRYKDFDGAAAMAQQAKSLPAEFKQFERSPDKLLEHIATQRRVMSLPSDRVVPPTEPNASLAKETASNSGFKLSRFPLPNNEAINVNDTNDTAKQEVLRLTSQAQSAFDRGDLGRAQQLVRQAQELRVPEANFEAGETRPSLLALEIEAAAKRRGFDVAPAANFEVQQAGGAAHGGIRYPVTQGGYNPNQDRSRLKPAQAELPEQGNEPTPARQLGPAGEGEPANGGSIGQQLYDEGIRALENQDRATALKSFKEAWRYAGQLDPVIQQKLREKLVLLQSDTAPAQLPPGREPSRLEAVDAKQEVLRQKLMREITVERETAERMSATDPKGALNRLQRVRERITQSELDPAGRKQLLTAIDRNINELERYIEQNLPEIENNERNARVMQDIDRDQRQKFETQNKIAELVEKFNTLIDERRYPEAEIIAKQALELDGEDPTVQSLLWKSRFVHRIAEQDSLKNRKEQGVYDTLTSVEESSIPFNDSEPIAFGDTKKWADLSRTRRKMLEQQRKRLAPSEIEIQRSLGSKVEVRFDNRPLKEVVETLASTAGINFYLDPQGMAVEGVTSDTPVSLNLTQPISLRSALNLILEPLRLSYVVQNEVLRITSEQTRESDVFFQTYNVADLIIPIPNFVPSYNTGLPSAIQEAHRTLGYGGQIPAMGGGPLTLASSSGGAPDKASALAQIGAAGLMPGGARGPQPLGSGPGGLSGGSQADYDTLISLLTTSVAPKTWAEVGGAGTIEPMPSNLSIVVSQTQEVHDQIADLLEQLRRLQDLQVTVEVRFITLRDRFFERLGVNFNFQINENSGMVTTANGGQIPDKVSKSTVIGLSPGTGAPASGSPTGDFDIPFTNNSFGSSLPPFGGFTATEAANFGVAILSDIEVFFLLQASAGDTRTNQLSAPKVTMFNGQQAAVFDTTQRPFVVGLIPVVGDFAAAHQPVIVVLNEGTSLSVQAVVSADRRFVRLTLVPFFSQIGAVDTFTFAGKTTTKSGTTKADPTNDQQNVTDGTETTTEGTTVQLPSFSFTTVTTTVSVPDGGTVLLGGIKRLSEGRTERGVPMLGKIPYLNRLFKNVGIGRETSSLMLMVTPRIIIQEEEEEKLGLRPNP